MTHRNIGGEIDLAALTALTDRNVTIEHHQYRPQDVSTMRAAIHELCDRGFSDHQIAQTTRLDVQYIRRILGQRPTANDTKG